MERQSKGNQKLFFRVIKTMRNGKQEGTGRVKARQRTIVEKMEAKLKKKEFGEKMDREIAREIRSCSLEFLRRREKRNRKEEDMLKIDTEGFCMMKRKL